MFKSRIISIILGIRTFDNSTQIVIKPQLMLRLQEPILQISTGNIPRIQKRAN